MGFTAINAMALPNTSPGQVDSLHVQQGNNQAADFVTSRQERRSVVSDYLGRGELDAIAEANAATAQRLCGKRNKNASNRGKKRASTAAATSNGKRRKINNVSNDMTVTEQSTSKGKAQDGVTLEKPRASREASPNPSSVSKFTEGVTTGEVASTISVFAPTTSMNTLSTQTQQTSLDAVKSSVAPGTTLYTHKPGNRGDEVSYARPTIDRNERSGNPANTRALRLRKGSTAWIARSGEAEQDVANASARESSNTTGWNHKVSGSVKSYSKQGKSHDHCRTKDDDIDEDFIGNDDGENVMFGTLELATRSAPSLRKRQESQNADRSRMKQQLPMPVTPDAAVASLQRSLKPKQRHPTIILTPDEEFIEINIDEDDDSELIDLTKAAEDAEVQRSPTPPPRERKLNMREVDKNETYGGALLSESERQLLEELRSSSNQLTSHQPIVRLPFPRPILDRSPVFGASNTTVLRTCFRIGEALKEGAQAVRCNKTVILELYARVTASFRKADARGGRVKQHFVFHDLYHDNPPYLEGEYEGFEQNRLFELDSKVFLVGKEGGRMCRAIAKMKREDKEWRLTVMSIWEAEWEDVEAVVGIYGRVPKEEE